MAPETATGWAELYGLSYEKGIREARIAVGRDTGIRGR